MTESSSASISDLALQLVVSLSSLETDDLVRLALQKPEITRVFASALHTLAVAKAALVVPTASSHDCDTAIQAIIVVLSRLMQRGDPSLVRKFVSSHGSLVDLCVVAYGLASKQVKTILNRLIDATAVKNIIKSLLLQLEASASQYEGATPNPTTVRLSARLLLSFLAACPTRTLPDIGDVLRHALQACFDVYNQELGQVKGKDNGDEQTLLLALKVDLMQSCSLLMQVAQPLPVDLVAAELSRSARLLQHGVAQPLSSSTVLLDLSSTHLWPSIRALLAAAELTVAAKDALDFITASALATSLYHGQNWERLQKLTSHERESQLDSSHVEHDTVSGDVLSTVDSILPHYGLDKLRDILNRDSFRSQDVETIVQRLLEGDEGIPSSSVVPGASSANPTHLYEQHSQSLPQSASQIRSRSNLFGDPASGPTSLVQLRPRTSKVEDLTPALKAAILARAEAADEDSDADEEWNPFAELQRTVGVEDELDLDFDGRERGAGPTRGVDDDDDEGHEDEDPNRARERLLIRHYIQSGSTAFSADQGVRKSANRSSLKTATGWSDDLIESWGVMFERNPMRDRLLAAATDSELQSGASASEKGHLDDENKIDGPKWGVDRGRGGRVLRGRGSSRGQTGRGGSQNATRGKGTGNSATDRSAKQKEKQGNKARQRGHDKKMARAGP